MSCEFTKMTSHVVGFTVKDGKGSVRPHCGGKRGAFPREFSWVLGGNFMYFKWVYKLG